MELPRRRMYGCEEEDAITLSFHQIGDDDVLNLYGNGTLLTAASTSASSATTEHLRHLCHREYQQARRSSSHVDVATDDEDEIAAAAATETEAVLVARDNQEVSRQNAEAAQRSAEVAREMAMASAVVAPRRRRHDDTAAAQRDNDDAAAAPAEAAARRAHAEMAHLLAHGVEELAGLRAEVAQRNEETVVGIIMYCTAVIFAPFVMAALLYYFILPGLN